MKILPQKPQESVSIQQGKDASKGTATKKAEKPAVHIAESVKADLSPTSIEKSKQFGADFNKIREVASQAPDVREAKIAKLKEQVSAGTYNPDYQKVAERMLQDHIELGMDQR